MQKKEFIMYNTLIKQHKIKKNGWRHLMERQQNIYKFI